MWTIQRRAPVGQQWNALVVTLLFTGNDKERSRIAVSISASLSASYKNHCIYDFSSRFTDSYPALIWVSVKSEGLPG